MELNLPCQNNMSNLFVGDVQNNPDAFPLKINYFNFTKMMGTETHRALIFAE
jgi:hypothetical protein